MVLTVISLVLVSVMFLPLVLAQSACSFNETGPTGDGICTCFKQNPRGWVVTCSGLSLDEVPTGIPEETVFLSLNENEISSISSTALAGLTLLETLQMRNNQLRGNVIENGAFSDLTSLQSLDLSGNRIALSQLMIQHLQPLVSLKTLTLTNNNINLIHQSAVEIFDRLDTLDLTANAFTCNCRLSWFRNWLINTGHVRNSIMGATCSTPTPLQRQEITAAQFCLSSVCYSCNGGSDAECNNKQNSLQTCSDSQQACLNEIRVSNGAYSIQKSCHQIQSCLTQVRNNINDCNTGTQNSVCRTCCLGDLCNSPASGVLDGYTLPGFPADPGLLSETTTPSQTTGREATTLPITLQTTKAATLTNTEILKTLSTPDTTLALTQTPSEISTIFPSNTASQTSTSTPKISSSLTRVTGTAVSPKRSTAVDMRTLSSSTTREPASVSTSHNIESTSTIPETVTTKELTSEYSSALFSTRILKERKTTDSRSTVGVASDATSDPTIEITEASSMPATIPSSTSEMSTILSTSSISSATVPMATSKSITMSGQGFSTQSVGATTSKGESSSRITSKPYSTSLFTSAITTASKATPSFSTVESVTTTRPRTTLPQEPSTTLSSSMSPADEQTSVESSSALSKSISTFQAQTTQMPSTTQPNIPPSSTSVSKTQILSTAISTALPLLSTTPIPAISPNTSPTASTLNMFSTSRTIVPPIAPTTTSITRIQSTGFLTAPTKTTFPSTTQNSTKTPSTKPSENTSAATATRIPSSTLSIPPATTSTSSLTRLSSQTSATIPTTSPSSSTTRIGSTAQFTLSTITSPMPSSAKLSTLPPTATPSFSARMTSKPQSTMNPTTTSSSTARMRSIAQSETPSITSASSATTTTSATQSTVPHTTSSSSTKRMTSPIQSTLRHFTKTGVTSTPPQTASFPTTSPLTSTEMRSTTLSTIPFTTTSLSTMQVSSISTTQPITPSALPLTRMRSSTLSTVPSSTTSLLSTQATSKSQSAMPLTTFSSPVTKFKSSSTLSGSFTSGSSNTIRTFSQGSPLTNTEESTPKFFKGTSSQIYSSTLTNTDPPADSSTPRSTSPSSPSFPMTQPITSMIRTSRSSDPTSISYSTTSMLHCPEETTTSDVGMIIWPRTSGSKTAEVVCPYGSINSTQGTATRLCRMLRVDVAWGAPNTSSCLTSTQVLTSLAETPVTPDNAEMISTNLTTVTNSPEELNETDIALAVDVLEGLARSVTGYNSSRVVENALETISNLVGAGMETLAASQRNAEIASRILHLVDDFALHVEFEGNQFEAITEWIDIVVVKINADMVNGLSFTNVVDDDGLQKPQVFFNSTEPQSAADAQASLELPGSLFESRRGEADRVQFVLYKNTIFFQVITDATDNGTISTTVPTVSAGDVIERDALNSLVISASVGDLKITGLRDPVRTSFIHQRPERADNPSCVFWDFNASGGQGSWSTEGCVASVTLEGSTQCECDHLTNFAILMDIYGTTTTYSGNHMMALSIITFAGCILSILGLIITFFSYIMIRQLRNDRRTRVLLNLVAALTFMNVLFLTDAVITEFGHPGFIACKVLGALLHYGLLTSIAWMALEAWHMYLALVKVFDSYTSHLMKKMCLVGWGLPAVIVGVVVGVDLDHYDFYNEFCWLQVGGIPFYAAFIAPSLAVIFFNFIIFSLVTNQLCSLRRRSVSASSEQFDVSAQLRASLSITVLLGLTWGLGIFMIGEASLVFSYLFAIFNSFQGFCIFVFHCLLKEEVRLGWRKLFCPQCLTLDEITKSSSGQNFSSSNKQAQLQKRMTIEYQVESNGRQHHSQAVPFHRNQNDNEAPRFNPFSPNSEPLYQDSSI